MTCRAMSCVVERSPELNAGWPQQLWRGTSTMQPASSRSFAAANPTDGRIKSTRQVTNSPTRLAIGSAISEARRGWPGQAWTSPAMTRKVAQYEETSFIQAHSHGRGDAVLTHVDACGFDVAVR